MQVVIWVNTMVKIPEVPPLSDYVTYGLLKKNHYQLIMTPNTEDIVLWGER